MFFQTMIVSVILPSATASRPTTNPMTTVVMHFTIVWGFSLHGWRTFMDRALSHLACRTYSRSACFSYTHLKYHSKASFA